MESTPTSTEDDRYFRKKFSLRRVMIPVVIGLLAAGWLLWHDLSKVRYERAPDGRENTRGWTPTRMHFGCFHAAEFTELAPGTGIYRK